MAKNQTVTSNRPKFTEEQRMNRICSILSIGVMRRIQTEKAKAILIQNGIAAEVAS